MRDGFRSRRHEQSVDWVPCRGGVVDRPKDVFGGGQHTGRARTVGFELNDFAASIFDGFSKCRFYDLAVAPSRNQGRKAVFGFRSRKADDAGHFLAGHETQQVHAAGSNGWIVRKGDERHTGLRRDSRCTRYGFSEQGPKDHICTLSDSSFGRLAGAFRSPTVVLGDQLDVRIVGFKQSQFRRLFHAMRNLRGFAIACQRQEQRDFGRLGFFGNDAGVIK